MPVDKYDQDHQRRDGAESTHNPYAQLRVGQNPQTDLQQAIVERWVSVCPRQPGQFAKARLRYQPGKPLINPHALPAQIQKPQGCTQEDDGHQAPADTQGSLDWLVFDHLAVQSCQTVQMMSR
jgi:hypothetical protein